MKPWECQENNRSEFAKPLDTFKFVGGAGIVASHASNLGAKAFLFSMTGNDSLKKFVTHELKKK